MVRLSRSKWRWFNRPHEWPGLVRYKSNLFIGSMADIYWCILYKIFIECLEFLMYLNVFCVFVFSYGEQNPSAVVRLAPPPAGWAAPSCRRSAGRAHGGQEAAPAGEPVIDGLYNHNYGVLWTLMCIIYINLEMLNYQRVIYNCLHYPVL